MPLSSFERALASCNVVVRLANSAESSPGTKVRNHSIRLLVASAVVNHCGSGFASVVISKVEATCLRQ